MSPTYVLMSILLCQRKAIIVSCVFAMIKIVTLSFGPLFHYAFIKVAEGRQVINYEVCVLTGGLLFAKCLESLAERQWFFRARLIDMDNRASDCYCAFALMIIYNTIGLAMFPTLFLVALSMLGNSLVAKLQH
ncbi:hypothetical protein LIER_36532 [Lithospermum erythrorhizon]|uniref:Uncharacterized protein n=1 Tax=Lithospermum erythrorhizon TaxID=34254 RepID=A0AAV3P7Q0_LITER